MQSAKPIGRWRLQYLPVAGGPFRDAKPQIVQHQRFYALKEEIVEPGSRLPANLNGIFESGGCDQRYARAFAFQERVGADGGSMQQYKAVGDANSLQCGSDCLGWVGRSRKHLQHPQAAIFSPHAVGEGATGVDGDAERFLSGRTFHDKNARVTSAAYIAGILFVRAPMLARDVGYTYSYREALAWSVPRVNARVNSVFCSTSCALADPVAGLALAERLTESTGLSPATLRKRGSM